MNDVSDLIKSTKSSAMSFLNRIKMEKVRNDDIMDPVSCVVRLCILNYLPKGTKISFSRNKINFQEPWFFQGMIRWTHGAGRIDLHNLYYPLRKFREWSSPKFGNDNDLDLLKDKCSDGLMCLRSSYSDVDMSICHSIDLYNQMLVRGVDDNDIKENTESTLYSNICNFWSEMEINIVCNMIREIGITIDDFQIRSYIKSIENVLSTKDYRLQMLINDTLSGSA